MSADILDQIAHRPWPLPNSPWVMRQTWNDLLFAHWPIDAERLVPKIPSSLTLDLFHGEAWLAIVPFRMSHVAPRAVPALPWVSAFPELNVRTYVRVGDRPGVYFFSLDAGNPLAVVAARTLFHLPYYSASIQVSRDDDTIHYASHRTSSDAPAADLVITYAPNGPTFQAQQGSLEYFLTERYCLYTIDNRGRPSMVEIHHPPWSLQRATAAFTTNTMADQIGESLPSVAPHLLFAKRQDVVNWTLRQAVEASREARR